MTTPSITVGWYPRERFAAAAESLQTLLQNTPPCRLIIVDPDTPSMYMEEIRSVLGDRDVEIISTGRHILPSAARNLIVERVRTDYVAFAENDVLVTPNWVEVLIEACEETPADVASPLLIEGRGTSPHFDKELGEIVESATHPGKYEVIPLSAPRHSLKERRKVTFVEVHCLVFRMSIFDRIGRFGELNIRDEVDLGLALWDAGCTAVVEPKVQVRYIAPTESVNEDELPFYRFRWDLDAARESRERIRERWNLVETPGDLKFVTYRHLMAQLPIVRRDLMGLASGPGDTVLVDNGDWVDTDVTADLTVIPFPNAGGHFGGFPASDDDAVSRLDRAIAAGAGRVVVGYPAFWWFDYLPGFKTKLNESFRLTRDDELMKVYESQ